MKKKRKNGVWLIERRDREFRIVAKGGKNLQRWVAQRKRNTGKQEIERKKKNREIDEISLHKITIIIVYNKYEESIENM